jgi:glycosyltransferase involved in cell wall biosynthesis
MKINIFVRHCKFSSNSANKPRPDWFTREGCFHNLINTLDKDCELTVSFDGQVSGSGHFIENEIYKGKFNLFQKKGGKDAHSFLNMIEYVNSLNIPDDEVIYFTEDDYLHNVGWAELMREAFHNIDADYVTMYDHNDKYFYPMYHELLSKVVCTKNIHWKTIPNTTNTYACLAKTFRRDYATHVKYCDLDRGHCRDFDKFAQFEQEGKTLINPIPGYSTHCEPQYMSPVIDWETVFNKTSKL